MERIVVSLDSSIKFQVIRQAITLANAIKDCAPQFTEPMETPLLTPDMRPCYLQNTYKGRSAFLACSGPSLASYDLEQLQQRGVLTMAVNNAGSLFRPNLWCCADPPYRFCRSLWEDPGVMKFLPMDMMGESIEYDPANPGGPPQSPEEATSSMPNTFGYIRNLKFDPETWLTESSVYLGQPDDKEDALGHKGARSVLLVALKLLYFLGVRRVYLLGCDFRMSEGTVNYAFNHEATAGAIKGNSYSYPILNDRLKRLKSVFDPAGFEVFNCNANSGLTAFPHKSFEEALSEMIQPASWSNAAGLYNRKVPKKKEILEIPLDWQGRVASPALSR